MSVDEKDRQPTARLYDVRYSRFAGTREPRWRGVLALARSSAGRALGLRRSTGAKIWPFLLLLVAYLPAAIVVGIPLLLETGDATLDLLSYDQLLATGTVVTVAYVVTTVPSLLTRDRRDRVLSLYFSTAQSPLEYLLGKLLAALLLTSLVTVGPLVVLYVGQILTSTSPLQRLQDVGSDAPAVLLGGFVVALYFAALGLLAGSLTGKRLFAVGGLLAVLLVTPVLAGLSAELTGRAWIRALDLATVALQCATRVLPDGETTDLAPAGAAWTVYVLVLAGAAVVLALRYVRAGRS